MATEPEVVGAASAAAAGILPFLWWVFRKVIRLLGQILEKFKSIENKVEEIDERVKKMEPVVAVVAAEFKPNGGSSMKDALDWLERKFSILECQHRTKFEGDGVATYECDAEGKYTYVSGALAELYGMPAEQFLGTGWLRAVIGTTERERVWYNWQYAIKNGIPYEDVYTVLAHGRPLRIRTYTRAAAKRDGRVICYFGMVLPAPPDSKLIGAGSTAGSSPPPTPDPNQSISDCPSGMFPPVKE